MSNEIAFPISSKYHATRDTLYVSEESAWTQYKTKNGIQITVRLIMDAEVRDAIRVLARKADEALALQLA